MGSMRLIGSISPRTYKSDDTEMSPFVSKTISLAQIRRLESYTHKLVVN